MTSQLHDLGLNEPPISQKVNYSRGDIAVLTEVCQTFAALCVLVAFVMLGVSFMISLHSQQRRDVKEAVRTSTKTDRRYSVPSQNCGVTHLAVIMDGNRRYGRSHLASSRLSPDAADAVPAVARENQLASLCSATVYGDAAPMGGASGTPAGNDSPSTHTGIVPEPTTSSFRRFCDLIRGTPFDGHRCGGEKLLEFIRYAIAADIPMLSVYAFSTDNWNRPECEVSVLMTLFFFFFQKVRAAARENGIFIRFISTRPDLLPPRILALMQSIECETRSLANRNIVVNVCVSYSGQTEIASAATRILKKRLVSSHLAAPVTTEELRDEMLRSITQDQYEEEDVCVFSAAVPREPQLILRTSGEQRLSNFLSFESAYSELFFLDKTWPEVTKGDLDLALQSYAMRDVRLGK